MALKQKEAEIFALGRRMRVRVIGPDRMGEVSRWHSSWRKQALMKQGGTTPMKARTVPPAE